MGELFKLLFVVGMFVLMIVIMVVLNGWAMAGLLLAILAAPGIVFGLIPYLLEGKTSGCGSNEKGYFYGYKYKFGAKTPKF